MNESVYLCKTSEIPIDTSKGFALENDNEEQTIFIINRNNQYYAYKNFCPHTGVPLNWQEDVYMDLDNLYIQCSIHGARFEVETGFCVWGPCVNQSLIPIDIEISHGKIFWKK